MLCLNEKAKVGFWFNVQKWPVLEAGVSFLPMKPHLDPKPDGCQGGRKSTGGALTSTSDFTKESHQGYYS